MSNPLNMSLTGKRVVLAARAFDEVVSEAERTVLVNGGFGAEMQENCLSFGGGKLYVEFPDGSTGAFRGMDVERLAP